MKYLYIGLLILCILLCACYFSTRSVDTRAQAVLVPLRNAMAAEYAGDAAGRVRFLNQAEGAWRQSMPVLDSLLSHTYSNEVSQGLRNLRFLSGTEFLRSCSEVCDSLQAMAEMDRIRLENIF